LEGAIRERPDHWYWIHRRWKTPPAPAVPAADSQDEVKPISLL
jgi:lauroyl/myristoyl acyltransferase